MPLPTNRPKPDERFLKNEPPFADNEFVSEYSTLYEYLAFSTYQDGSARKTTTMLIFFEGPVLKVCLNDRDLGRSAFFTGTSFHSLLKSIDDQLCAGTVDWRSKPGATDRPGYTPF